MFCVVPLLFLALCLWLARGCRGRSSSPRSPPSCRLRSFSRCRSGACSTSASSRTRSASSRCTGWSAARRRRRHGQGADVGRDHGGSGVRLPPAQLARLRCRRGSRCSCAASFAVFDSIRDHSLATKAQTGATDPSWIDDEIGSGAQARSVRRRRRSVARRRSSGRRSSGTGASGTSTGSARRSRRRWRRASRASTGRRDASRWSPRPSNPIGYVVAPTAAAAWPGRYWPGRRGLPSTGSSSRCGSRRCSRGSTRTAGWSTMPPSRSTPRPRAGPAGSEFASRVSPGAGRAFRGG